MNTKTTLRRLCSIMALCLIVSRSWLVRADDEGGDGGGSDNSDCPTCSESSDTFTQYIDFSQEMIQTLEQMANNNQQNTDQSGGTSETNQIAETLNEGEKAVKTFEVFTDVVSSQLIASSSVQEVSVLGNAQALKRDRDKLDKVSQDITKTIFDLGNAGVIRDNTAQSKSTIMGVFQQYSTLFKVQQDDGSNLDLETLLTALRDLNQAFKRFIGGGSTVGFDTFSSAYTDDLNISLVTDTFDKTLADDYQCTRGFNACDANVKEFDNNINSSTKKDDESTDNSDQSIDKSVNNLDCTLADNADGICAKPDETQDEKQKLATLYGSGGWFSQHGRTPAIGPGLTSLGDSLAEQNDSLRDFSLAPKDGPGGTSGVNTTTENQTITQASQNVDITSVNARDDLETTLIALVNTTVDTSRKSRQETVLGDPLPDTTSFASLSILIAASDNKIDTSGWPDGALKDLEKSCELQCSNLQWTCSSSSSSSDE